MLASSSSPSTPSCRSIDAVASWTAAWTESASGWRATAGQDRASDQLSGTKPTRRALIGPSKHKKAFRITWRRERYALRTVTPVLGPRASLTIRINQGGEGRINLVSFCGVIHYRFPLRLPHLVLSRSCDSKMLH
jgi:hypothetical protein